MKRHPFITKDGSYTIAIPEMKVMYHSVYGAMQESMHVFINAGFRYKVSDAPAAGGTSDTLRIFEMGFGTGLNALLTLIEAEKIQRPVHYTAIELYPLEKEELAALNYCQLLNRGDLQPLFEQLHDCKWDEDISVTPFFTLHKLKADLLNLPAYPPVNLVYFDAFAPFAQPELWTKDVFEKLYSMMMPGGVLVTYCSKGDVRRAMQAAGFIVEKIPGPAGKREMLQGKKPIPQSLT